MNNGANKMNNDTSSKENTSIEASKKAVGALCVKVRAKAKVYTCRCSEKLKNLQCNDRVFLMINNEQEYGITTSSTFPCNHLEHIQLPEVLDKTFIQNEEEKKTLDEKEKEIIRYCKDRTKHYKLEMEFIKADYALDNSKVVVYFTAEKRIDFRELVKDVNSYLKSKTRIELWQISSREKAVLIGGIGICGLEICCRKLCRIPETVSIRTVKDQHLEINPLKITGICGKLMCCLTYEHQQYIEMSKDYPKVGKRVTVNEKNAIVKNCNVIKGTVTVEFEENGTMEVDRELVFLS
jgi:cell fate regulator YaaT (PSP1 superfamily)